MAEGTKGPRGFITLAGAIAVVLILIAAVWNDRQRNYLIQPPANSIGGQTTSPFRPTTTTVPPTTTTIASTTPAETAPGDPTAPTTTTVAVAPSGIVLVTGDAKTMSTVQQNAPCTIHLAAGGQPLPDPSCTPGAVSDRVTQDNIAFTICVAGYTKAIRAPTSQTNKAKAIVALAYNVVGVDGEYDHLIPLELGGANDVRNLWLEPGKIPNPKDAIENKLHDLVCAGKMTLADAQQRMARDWSVALQNLPGVPTSASR